MTLLLEWCEWLWSVSMSSICLFLEVFGVWEMLGRAKYLAKLLAELEDLRVDWGFKGLLFRLCEPPSNLSRFIVLSLSLLSPEAIGELIFNRLKSMRLCGKWLLKDRLLPDLITGGLPRQEWLGLAAFVPGCGEADCSNWYWARGEASILAMSKGFFGSLKSVSST